MSYRKVMWTGPAGDTAGLVLESAKIAKLTTSDLSRLWPLSEARKMHHCLLSPEFPTWDEAFAFNMRTP